MSQKQKSHFWTSYSDLMTSLFFVMFVLFILAIAMLNKKMREIEAQKEATEAELKKIREIEASIQAIDPTYFEYNPTHKKHVLKIDVQFQTYSYDLNDIPDAQREELKRAGRSISRFLKEAPADVQYLLIIEGQASRDNYGGNDELSYNRANALRYFWKQQGIDFGDKCEVIVCGSGQDGVMRAQPDNRYNEKNQRFLIHILPKPGVLDSMEKNKAEPIRIPYAAYGPVTPP